MYGMVNQGIKEYVTSNLGDPTWRKILEKSGLDSDQFETMLAYDDDMTYRLVFAASDVLELSTDQVLEAFGKFWVNYAGDTAIGRLLDFGGETLFELLDSLNEMHERIQMSLPHLRPPSFEFEMSEGNVHQLHYYSEREGLQPMVIGLVKGLALKCGENVQIRIVQSRLNGADHDIFELEVDESLDAKRQVA